MKDGLAQIYELFKKVQQQSQKHWNVFFELTRGQVNQLTRRKEQQSRKMLRLCL